MKYRYCEMVHVAEVRRRCQIVARRFRYPEYLFNRIPMYIFRYFKSADPLLGNSAYFTQLNVITIFMIINGIDAGLMMAFYNEGEQSIDTIFELHRIFVAMWRLYRTTEPFDHFSVFGQYFSYHLETRSLRRIDMSIVNYDRSNHEPFVPDQINWRRWREVRRLILAGQFRVDDDYDLLEVREAMRNGMRQQRGRNQNQR